MKSTKQENMMDKIDMDLQRAEETAITFLYLADLWEDIDVPCDAICTGYVCKKVQHHMEDLI